MHVLLLAIAFSAGCLIQDHGDECHTIATVGGSTYHYGAAVASDRTTGAALVTWGEQRIDPWQQQLDSGLLTADGAFTPLPPFTGPGAGPWVTATAGGYLINDGSIWLVLDSTGVLVSDPLPLPDTSYGVIVVGVSGGFLVAVKAANDGDDLDADLALYAVGLDGSVALRGSLGEATGVPWRNGGARIADQAWITYGARDGMNLVRLDDAGVEIDRFVFPAMGLIALAGAGDRGMAFGTSAMIPIDASGPGAAVTSPFPEISWAFGFPGLGYLAGWTWLDLDGGVLGTLDTIPDRSWTQPGATATSLVLAWTEAPPQSLEVGDNPSRLRSVLVPFGASAALPDRTLTEAFVTAELRTVPCPPDEGYFSD